MSEMAPTPFSMAHLMQPDLLADPYGAYSRLRAQAPIYRDPTGAWVLTRYADVAAALRDPRLSSARMRFALAALPPDQKTALGPLYDAIAPQMLFQDPPAHTRLRGLADQAWNRDVLDSWRPRVQAIVDELLDRAAAAGHMDVMADLAFPLVTRVLAGLLGVAPADQAAFDRWAADFGAILRDLRTLTPDAARAYAGSVSGFTAHFRALVAERRAAPGPDVLSGFLAATRDGERLTDDEVIGLAFSLLAGGRQEAPNLIGNGVLALLRHPQEHAKLAADPALIGPAVEELLRYDSPIQAAVRLAAEPLTLDGADIGRGHPVILMLGAANRDPARFPDPDRLDLTRADVRHVAFGGAHHYCFGAPLARLQGQVAIGTLVRRFPNLRLTGAPPAWIPNTTFRGMVALPVLL